MVRLPIVAFVVVRLVVVRMTARAIVVVGVVVSVRIMAAPGRVVALAIVVAMSLVSARSLVRRRRLNGRGPRLGGARGGRRCRRPEHVDDQGRDQDDGQGHAHDFLQPCHVRFSFACCVAWRLMARRRICGGPEAVSFPIPSCAHLIRTQSRGAPPSYITLFASDREAWRGGRGRVALEGPGVRREPPSLTKDAMALD